MRQLWTMTVWDLRQRVRDKSVFIFALVVPLALIAVFNLVLGDAEELELQPVTVAIDVPSGDGAAAVLLETIRELELDGLSVSTLETSVDQVREQVDRGDADLGIVVPAGFEADVQAGRSVAVQVIEGDGVELETQIVLSVTDGVLQQLAAGSAAAAAAATSGVPPQELAEVARAATSERPEYTLVEGDASAEQLDPAAALVAGQAGLFLLFTVGFGVLALVGERESGTLARLRSMPMRPGLIVLAKALVSLVLGVVATSVLLLVGGLLFGVGFGSLVGVAVLVLCAVTAATSIVFVIARVARTSEQAGIAQSITAIVLGVAGGAFFPVSGSGVLGAVLDLNPIAAFTRGLGINAGGEGLAALGEPVAIMVGFAVAMIAVSRLVPDRGATA